MPFCPNCQMEYREGIPRCSDCDIELVDSLPDDALSEVEPEDVDLVEIASFANVSEADMIKELLESNGIQTIVRGDIDPIGATSGAAPITLLVEGQDQTRAREIYDAFFAGDAVEVESPPQEPE